MTLMARVALWWDHYVEIHDEDDDEWTCPEAIRAETSKTAPQPPRAGDRSSASTPNHR